MLLGYLRKILLITNIINNCMIRQRTKTKDSVMSGIGLNNSIAEATR